MTLEKGVYLYVYLLLDEFSRKALNWRIDWTQTATEARLLLEGRLVQENILDPPEEPRPEPLNDRGRQMNAKPIRQPCEDYHKARLPSISDGQSTYLLFYLQNAKKNHCKFLDDREHTALLEQYFD